MQEYTVEHSSIECRWVFKRMLPSLPGPGSAPFANLVRAFESYGIDPSGITVDAPSSRMADVVLSLVLLDKRVAVRVTASSFDLFASPLYVGDEPKLIEIAKGMRNALREIDPDSEQAEAKVRTSSHLNLVSGNADTFLNDHLKLNGPVVSLVPDAIAYKLTVTEGIRASAIRVILSKSIAYSNAIFLEFSAEYSKAPDSGSLAAWVTADFEELMNRLSLKEVETT